MYIHLGSYKLALIDRSRDCGLVALHLPDLRRNLSPQSCAFGDMEFGPTSTSRSTVPFETIKLLAIVLFNA